MHAFVCGPFDTTEMAVKVACIKSHEDAQTLRDRGQLIESRSALLACVDDSCPSPIRADCAQLLREVEASVPTIVIEIRSADSDVRNVTVRVDGVQADYAQGLAMRVNPGVRKIEVLAPLRRPISRAVLVHVGERNQRVVLDLDGGAAPPGEPQVGPPRAGGSAARSDVPAFVATGIAVVGFASFGIAGALGLSRESELRDTCSPRCASSDVDGVRTRYLVANVGLVAGVVSGAVATWLFVRGARAGAAP